MSTVLLIEQYDDNQPIQKLVCTTAIDMESHAFGAGIHLFILPNTTRISIAPRVFVEQTPLT